MKKIKKWTLAFLLVLITGTGFSQKVLIENDDLNTSLITSFDSRPKNLVGTSYLDEVYRQAVYTMDDKVYRMRYDAYVDEMEVQINDKPHYVTKILGGTVSFIESSKMYKVYTYTEKKLKKTGFFVMLSNGPEISLLLKEKIKFYKEVPQNLGFVEYQPPTLKRAKDEIYVGFKNNSTMLLPKKKKDILKMFSSKSKQVESFVKKNKLSFKSQADLIEIFGYYNSLN